MVKFKINEQGKTELLPLHSREGIYINEWLKSNLDILIKTIKRDWHFVLLITGSGMVRIGKSVLGQQIGVYIAGCLGTKFGLENIVFTPEELIRVAKTLPPYSVLIFDEGRFGLSTSQLSRILINFFNECGQLNLFVIVIAPEFFEFKPQIAVTMSIALLNVYYEGEFQRGFFNFYNIDMKRKLYYKGKKHYNDYSIVQPNFSGNFADGYAVDREAYQQKKLQAFLNRKELIPQRHINWMRQRDILIRELYFTYKLQQKEIAELIVKRGDEISRQEVCGICSKGNFESKRET